MRSTLWLALALAGCPEPEAVDAVDDDGDGYVAGEDCNDGAPSVFPGAIELCDGIDQDCDGSLDDEPTLVLFEDRDGDGYGDPGQVVSACAVSQGVVANGADCDDEDDDISPAATETCDGVDDNCSGGEEDATDGLPWYYDGDGDTYGTNGRVYACEQPEGYADRSGDCRDGDEAISPGADEACNGVDDDCDGDIDEADAVDVIAWYPDEDADGFGVVGDPVYGCEAPEGYGEGSADCDDRAPGNYPGAAELCDGIDQDCDGAVDEEPTDGSIWYTDNDLDGAGDASRSAVRCAGDVGLVSSSDDCDDADSATFPGAEEVCDGADNDCDGAVDGLWLDADFASENPLSLNGAAAWDTGGARIRLTEAEPDLTGTAWYRALPDDRFVARFTFESSGGTAGQGLALAFLDESDPTLVGSTDVFGLGGLQGYAVGFDSVADLVVLIKTSNGATLEASSVAPLHGTGPHEVVVAFDAGAVDVSLDGASVLAHTITSYTGWMPLVGLSAATTSSATADQGVDDLAIGCP